jgi:hypothetical protein
MTDPAVLDEPGPLVRRCHLKAPARSALFTHVGAQRLVFDPGRKQGNHPIENPQLKTDKGEIQLKEMSAVINFTLSSAATARSSGRTSAGRIPAVFRAARLP